MPQHKHLTKHRPYLTEQTILWLYNKASELRLEDEGANIAFMEIAPYTLKLNLKTVGGSYTSSPKETLLDSLGSTDPTPEELLDRKVMYDGDSLDDWHAADPNIPDK